MVAKAEKEKERRAEYMAERDRLIQGQAASAATIDKYLVTIAGGALGLVLAFMKDLAGDSPQSLCALFCGVFALTLSLVFSLASFLFSHWGWLRQSDLNDKCYIEGKDYEFTNIRPWVFRSEVAAFIALITGIVLCAIFAIENL